MMTAKKKESTERRVLLGKRMKLAAVQAGLGKVQPCGEATGLHWGTISRYWRGMAEPSVDDLAHYAAVMGKPVAWFYKEGMDEEDDTVADALVRIVDASMRGQSLPEAHQRVTGELDRFGRRERERLAAGTNALLDRINQETAGRWNDLDARQKRAVMVRLRSEAERLRG